MRIIKLFITLIGLLGLTVIQLTADDKKGEAQQPAKRTIGLAALVRGFAGTGPLTAISVSSEKDAAYAAAICDESKQLHFFSGSGGKWKRMMIPLDVKKAPHILLHDLDGDGKNEVLLCSEKLQVFKATDLGLSLAWTSAESFEESPAPKLGVADFDQDNRKDIAVLNYKVRKQADANATQSLYIYHQQGNNDLSFGVSGSITLTDAHGYHSTAGLAIGDFCGNAGPEIVVGNDNGHLWLVAMESGIPKVRKEWKVPSGGAVGPGLAAGNFDRDEHAELLVGTNGGDIFVMEFQDNGEPTVLASTHAGRLAYGVGASDVNGDGLDEFILTRGNLGYAGMTQKDVVAEVWQLEAGQLKRLWQQQTVGFRYPRLLLHDTDGDGVNDVIVYSVGDSVRDGKQIEVLRPRDPKSDVGPEN